MKNFIAVLSILSLFAMSCDKKDDDTIPELNDECFWELQLDSAQVADKLVDKWKWQYAFLGGKGVPEFSDDASKGLSLEFKSDGTLLVKRKGEAPQSGTWSLRFAWEGYYNIIVSPFVNETFGVVMFCENQLLFNGGVGDGPNNYFKRD